MLRKMTAAVRALDEGSTNVMVSLAFPNVQLEEVGGRMKSVPLDSDTLLTGRDICLGD